MGKSYMDCVGVIQKASGDYLTTKQAEQILAEVDNIAQIKKASGQLDAVNAMVMDEIDNATNALREAALIEKRNALINVKVKKQVLDYVNKFKDPGEGMMALLGGKHTRVEGALASIDAQGKAVVDGMLGKFINSLEKEGLMESFSSGAYDREIAVELWNLPHGKPGITGVEEAAKIAGFVHDMQNTLVLRQNRAGAFIKLMPGYIVRQAHDMFKIRKAGFEEWSKLVAPLLDEKATFGNNMDPKVFLKEAYDGFTSGMHYKAKAENAADSVTYFLGFKGPSNLAQKVSQERVLHFKDAEAWLAYNEAFGHESLREAIIGGVEHSGRNIALMENLGTNPLNMIDQVLKVLRSAHKDDPKIFDMLKDHNIHNLYMQLDGTARIPVYHKVAAIGAGIRSLQNMAKLGGAVLSSITDIPFQAANLRLNGVNIIEAYTNAFTNILRGRGSAEQKEIARLVGVGFEGLIRDISTRFSATDQLPGTMAKLQAKYFKLNGMNWWNDSHKTGVSLILSNHIAELRNTPFDKLPGQLKPILNQYGIKEADWKLVGELSEQHPDGQWYFTPDKLQTVSESRLIEVYGYAKETDPSVTSRDIRGMRDDLETKWRTYFVDQINHAIPHPGAAEQAFSILGGGTQPGTTLGEALRFIGQFKSFPITVVRKGLAPHLYQNEGSLWSNVAKGKSDYVGLVHLMVATTIFGYLAGAAKDTARGLTPRDPRDPKTWVKAMAQGGGLGLYGDFLFGEFNKYGNSALASLMGPTFSNFEDLMKIFSRAKEGDKVAGQMMRVAINNTPFANLFYTRMSMDYLFLYQLQESVNPGYLSRVERRIMNENKQQFYIPPTQQIPYGGGDKVLEGVR
jgi:hypothetical protein